MRNVRLRGIKKYLPVYSCRGGHKGSCQFTAAEVSKKVVASSKLQRWAEKWVPVQSCRGGQKSGCQFTAAEVGKKVVASLQLLSWAKKWVPVHSYSTQVNQFTATQVNFYTGH